MGEPSLRRQIQDININNEQLQVEQREVSIVRAKACKQIVVVKVKPRSFSEGDLVWGKTSNARKKSTHGKLAPNWEGLFMVNENMKNGLY